MTKQYGSEKGNRIYYSWVNKNKYDDTKPYPKGKSPAPPTPPSERTVKQEYGTGMSVSEPPFKPNKDVRKLEEEFREALKLLPKAAEETIGFKPLSKSDPPVGTLHVDPHPEIIPANVPHIVGPPGAIPVKHEEYKTVGVTPGGDKTGPSKKLPGEPVDKDVEIFKYNSPEKPKAGTQAPDPVDTKNKPWYEQNRPYGAPLSPFQKVTAEKFSDSFNEILAAFKNMDSNSRPSPEKVNANTKALLEKAFLSSQK
jgi:hypothetical protein